MARVGVTAEQGDQVDRDSREKRARLQAHGGGWEAYPDHPSMLPVCWRGLVGRGAGLASTLQGSKGLRRQSEEPGSAWGPEHGRARLRGAEARENQHPFQASLLLLVRQTWLC